MRIGLVSYEYPPQNGFGGVGSYTYRLAGALGKAGHEVTVLAGPAVAPEWPQPNVTVHRLPARYDPPVAWRSLRWAYWHVLARLMQWANPMVWHWLRWDLASSGALLDIHRQTPLDVVEAPEHAANALMVSLKGVWPMVLRIHGPWDLFFRLNRNPGLALNYLLSALEKASVRRTHLVTAPSLTMARFMHRHWNLSHMPLVVHNFLDVPPVPPPLPPEEGEQRIFCAGRIERFKGQDVLVRAFAMIAPRHPRARLVLVGPDQWARGRRFSSVIRDLVPADSIRGRIELTGPLPLRQTQEHLAHASIVVVPSTGFESFSFSTLEAMAAARPVIVARSGALPELLDEGRCGRIVPPGDAPGLAEALDELLSSRRLREQFSGAAHSRARAQYDTRVVVPRILAVYRQAREVFSRNGELDPSRAIA